MKLIFLRHGIAADKKNSQTELDDASRELTREGVIETKEMIKALKPIFKGMDIIFSSPMVRAVETAQILSKYFPRKSFELLNTLDSSVPCDLFVEEVKKLKPDGKYCFVGHEPHLTTSIGRLLKETSPSVELDKSGIVILEGRSIDHLKVTFVISPAFLEQIKA